MRRHPDSPEPSGPSREASVSTLGTTTHHESEPHMRAQHCLTTGSAWVLTTILVATACHREGPKSPGLAHQLEELALVAERDSLQREVASTDQALRDIEGALASALPAPVATGTPESPTLEVTTDRRAYAVEQAKEVTNRLKAARSALATSERRVRRLTATLDTVNQGYSEARANIAQLATVVGEQRVELEQLTHQLEEATTANLTLADSVYHLTDAHRTAYYVIGTRAELVQKGVLVEEGHRAIPLVGRRDITPARELPLVEFTSIDREVTREIPLPRPDRQYRIVSRQNLSQLGSWVGSKGRVKGSIAIRTPEQFWEPSKFLIVVEQ